MKDAKTIEEFIILRAQGWSFDRIAKKLKAAKQTLINLSRTYSVEISHLKALELEALQEQYFLTKEGKIKLLGEAVKKLKTELDKRDLSDVPTAKLYELLDRYHELARAEVTEPDFRDDRALTEAKAEAGLVTALLAAPGHLPPANVREPWIALLEAGEPKIDQKQTGGPSTGVDTGGATVNGR